MEPAESSNQQANEAIPGPSETDNDPTTREYDSMTSQMEPGESSNQQDNEAIPGPSETSIDPTTGEYDNMTSQMEPGESSNQQGNEAIPGPSETDNGPTAGEYDFMTSQMEPGESSNQHANEAIPGPSETNPDPTIGWYDAMTLDFVTRYDRLIPSTTDLVQLTNRARSQMHSALHNRYHLGIDTEQQAWYVVETLTAGISELFELPVSLDLMDAIGDAIQVLANRPATEIMQTAHELVALFGEMFLVPVSIHAEAWEPLRAMVLWLMADTFDPRIDPIPFNLTRDPEPELSLEPFPERLNRAPPRQENAGNQGEASRHDEEQTWEELGSNERPVSPDLQAARQLLRRRGVGYNCAICQERMRFRESFGRLGCGHWFHAECLLWQARAAFQENANPRCAICRAEITSGSSSSEGNQRGPTRDQPETQAEVPHHDDTHNDTHEPGQPQPQPFEFQAGEGQTVISSSNGNGQGVNVSNIPGPGAPTIEIVQEVPREPRAQMIAQPIIIQFPLMTGPSPRVRIFQQVEPEPQRSTADADVAAQAAAAQPAAQTTDGSQFPEFQEAVFSEAERQMMNDVLLDPSTWPPEVLVTDDNAGQSTGQPAVQTTQTAGQTTNETSRPDPRTFTEAEIQTFDEIVEPSPSRRPWIWRLMVAVWAWVVATWLALWSRVVGLVEGFFLLLYLLRRS